MQNAALDIIKGRRSIRQYEKRQIAGAELAAVLEAGTFAPSGKGGQSAVIVAVQNAELIAKLTAMNAKIMGVDKDTYYAPPTILLVFADGGKPTYVQDGSAVLTTMGLAAHAIGLGACWINREAEMFASPEGKELLKSWGLPDNLVGVGALSIGYPAGDAPKAAPRKADYIVKIA